jgi:hypothetical protein
MLRKKANHLLFVSIVSLLILPYPTLGQKDKDKNKNLKTLSGAPVLWREPADIESRNLLLGAGGDAMKPDVSHVTFIEQKQGGFSTKYRVRDAAGNEWVAKIGSEAQPDTSANRLLWAAGYETEIAYLIPHLVIDGKGAFDNVRLEARPKGVKRSGNWSWEENPFKGTPQFQGLKIMMLLINNWDMKDENNEILATRDEATGEDEVRYIISDLGGSFGKTGGVISRSRNKPSDYVKANFIEKVNGETIAFHYGGKNKKLFENISIADARWLSSQLNRLSDEQIKDAFRAANYSAAQVDQLSSAFRERLNTLIALGK